GRADAAAATIDKNGFAFLQPGVARQAEARGDADQCDGRGVFVADAIGRRVQPTSVDGAEFGEGALTPEQTLIAAPDTVSRFEARHRGTHFNHGAREVAADD